VPEDLNEVLFVGFPAVTVMDDTVRGLEGREEFALLTFKGRLQELWSA
jgi:hypothetical protein